MTVNISLDPKHSIISYQYGWTIAEVDGDRISYLTYHSSLESALNSYLDMKLRLSNSKSIHSLIEYIKSLHTAIYKLLQPLQIKVESELITK